MSGKLAGLDLTVANTDQQLYVVPVSKVTSLTVCFANRNAQTVKVRLALTTTTSPANTDYIAYDIAVPANDSYERSGLALGAGQYVYVRSDTVGVSVAAWGFEDAV